MASLDEALADLGCRVARCEGATVVLDAAELDRAMRRFRVAAAELRAAWDALPPGIREEYACTIRLGAPPDEAA